MNEAAAHLRKRANDMRGFAKSSDTEAETLEEQATREREAAANLRAKADEYEAAANVLAPQVAEDTAPVEEEKAA